MESRDQGLDYQLYLLIRPRPSKHGLDNLASSSRTRSFISGCLIHSCSQGDFDWFFEGFSLIPGVIDCTGFEANQLSGIPEHNRASLDSYLSYSQNESLVEASERRWVNPGTYVYDKGMLVAFMYDLIARSQDGTRLRFEVYRNCLLRLPTSLWTEMKL